MSNPWAKSYLLIIATAIPYFLFWGWVGFHYGPWLALLGAFVIPGAWLVWEGYRAPLVDEWGKEELHEQR